LLFFVIELFYYRFWYFRGWFWICYVHIWWCCMVFIIGFFYKRIYY